MCIFSNFKQYMDAQPIIRNYMFAFYNREYSSGLKALEALKKEYKLDLFLNAHVDDLYDRIRSESLNQVTDNSRVTTINSLQISWKYSILYAAYA